MVRLLGRLAALVLAIILAGCGRTYFGEPLDSSAADVVPAAGPDAATIAMRVEPEDALPPGIEGAVLFARLLDGDGKVILDRPFNWPKDEQRVPPGSYHLVAYLRGCNGSCGLLSPEVKMCESPITAASGSRIEITVTPRSLVPGTTCTIAPGSWDRGLSRAFFAGLVVVEQSSDRWQLPT